MLKRKAGIAIVVGGIGIGVLYFLFNPATSFFPKCPVYQYSGYYCTGCGSQRTFHQLLHINLLGAIRQNILATVVFIALALDLILWVLKKDQWRPYQLLHKRYAALWVLGVVVVFTVLRNIPIYPFSLLAPH